MKSQFINLLRSNALLDLASLGTIIVKYLEKAIWQKRPLLYIKKKKKSEFLSVLLIDGNTRQKKKQTPKVAKTNWNNFQVYDTHYVY